MRVCLHKGLVIAVLTRNEHCPPHVHVGSDKWEARFEFSFWHNSVHLLDVMPAQNQPTAAVLEELRQVIKKPENLRSARELWWRCVETVCMINQQWDMDLNKVIDTKSRRSTSYVIKTAMFDKQTYKTILQLAGQSVPLEIEL